MINTIKKIGEKHSWLLIILTIAEIIISIISTLAFVYSDGLSYGDSLVYNALGVEKLLESLYSSTFWALILVVLALIAIFSLTCLFYKKLEYLFISIALWVLMMVLAVNLNNSFVNNLAMLAIFIPIIILNVIAYFQEKEKIEKKPTKKKAHHN